MYDLDVGIFESSRPQLIPYSWKSFKKYFHFRGNMRIIVHEDFVIPEQSERSMTFWNKLEQNGEVQEVHYSKPAIGLGFAMNKILKQRVKAKYFYNFQGDWELERPVDVDRLLWCMDENPEINLIVFNKIKNTGSLSGISQPQFEYSGVRMCLYSSWSFMPGIWRMDFAMKHWRTRQDRPEGYMTNAFGSHEERSNNEHCRKNMGAYLLGQTGDFRYVRHIGNDWRMASWRMENGQPGGCHDAERMDLPYRANWLPELEPRPVFKEGYSAEEVDRMLAEEAGIN